VNSWAGSGQTGDACALFDTTPADAVSSKGKGMADFAVCVRINNPNGDPTVVAQLAAPASPLLYSCGDSKSDRCASSINSLALGGIVCGVEKVSGENYFAAGEDGADVLAACSIPLSAISATATPNLINVRLRSDARRRFLPDQEGDNSAEQRTAILVHDQSHSCRRR
jgi:hypothetical protein